MSTATDISQKNYHSLHLAVTESRLSWCIIDTFEKAVLDTGTQLWSEIESAAQAFWLAPMWHQAYDSLQVWHYSPWQTWVPQAMHDPDFNAAYLQFYTQLFETDQWVSDVWPELQMVQIFIPWTSSNNRLIDPLGTFEYRHLTGLWVQYILHKTRWQLEASLFLHKSENQLDMVIAKQGKLLLSNAFEVSQPEDSLYYVLFAMEQWQLSPETTPVALYGDWSAEDPHYQLLYTYIRHLDLDMAQTGDSHYTSILELICAL